MQAITTKPVTFRGAAAMEQTNWPDKCGATQRSLISRGLHAVSGLILALTVESLFAQIDVNIRTEPTQQVISMNQLLTPQKAQRATERARNAFMLGRFEEADKQAKRALDIFPRCANALTVEGLIRMQDRDDGDALRLFQEAIDADPTMGVAYLAMGEIFNSQGRFKEALVPLSRAAAFLPGVWSVHYETARAKLGGGEVQSGLIEIAYAERFIGTDPKNRSALSFLRGVANLLRKDYTAGKQYLNDAIERDPKGPYAVLARKALERSQPSPINGK
jgi:tetratricopeptide (TPR) repeat protein